ncbi:hypothetical protein TVAG_369930 [Trichomonas vaginalis G3]|uniref:Serine aminopeptidase S33 domain-containing protein n=1 Tax=Trichomonas vaginalis (strain ATCC PRA-98 / G3) TaxID=412133 RepID=A2EX45_TRIV3|nr:palmitoyl-(protein) hydrolase protein [Trichomonas vaginalis G3]EAY02765.1 hypothetical protein TVAG_369930 [Trichomonas vaginalis G3]KAI5500599.1 palmitoyl-(protein) hydrolase protein [Trichomonas vaginalis G3]|eukprot:XP_001314988.1 hypothetical protein [Trichomonas vaginalis G3]
MTEKKGTLATANTAIDLITRPPRGEYSLKNLGDIEIDPLLPKIPRIPVTFRNSQNLALMGSLYAPYGFPDVRPPACVIYLHGNAGTQVEGRFMVKYLAPKTIATFCFDFAGSGNSDGETVTLGLNEKQDVEDVVRFLEKSFGLKKFILWGRSMGAATTFLAAPMIPNCIGIISDSPYASIKWMFDDMAKKVKIPGIVKGPALWYVKHCVNGKINADITEVSPIDEAKKLSIPLIIGHAAEDSFIPYYHAQKLYDIYKGKDKLLMPLPGDHNSKRPVEWLNTCFNFICRLAGIEFAEISVCEFGSNPGYQSGTDEHFRSYEEMARNQK